MRPEHAALAGLSKAYLAYCDCTRGADEKTTIVAAFTAGDVDNLMVGRNGVFYDRKNRDWDARITNIVENPISVRQAFWSPYKRLVRMVEEQVAKRAAAKEKESSGQDGHRRGQGCHGRPGGCRSGRAGRSGCTGAAVTLANISAWGNGSEGIYIDNTDGIGNVTLSGANASAATAGKDCGSSPTARSASATWKPTTTARTASGSWQTKTLKQ